MKHHVSPRCRHECRFLQISKALWLCPHAAYGEASYYKDAVEDARRALERAGGYEAVLARVMREEEARKQARREALAERRQQAAAAVRYG